MKRRLVWWVSAGILVLVLILGSVFLSSRPWIADQWKTSLRVMVAPIRSLPTAESAGTPAPTQAGKTSPPVIYVPPTPRSSQPQLPEIQSLIPPYFDRNKDFEDWNNCGPATLALALRFWGWHGDQYKISAIVKPQDQDKNVNMDELSAYATGQAGFAAVSRVAGDTDTLKRLISAGYPVIIETSFRTEKAFWPGDDLWASHFVLLTGYDDEKASFISQDVFYGPDTAIPYNDLIENWKSFDYLYMVVFPPDHSTDVSKVLASDWSQAENLQKALSYSQAQVKNDPEDAFGWFNLGSELTALGQYKEAWSAFNRARQIGLPQRMLRYQFTPFEAAYGSGNVQDLLELTQYALQVTPNSEEALYWQGKAYEATQQKNLARQSYLHALSFHPGYAPAIDALNALK